MIKKHYLIEDDITEIIKTELYEHYRGKIDFTGPDSPCKIHVKTGLAGIRSMNAAIKKMAITSGLVINASDVKDLSTTSGSYTSYTIPFLGTVSFETCSNFDENKDIMIRGYSLDSYTYELYDDPNTEPFMKLVLGKTPYHIKGIATVFMGGEYYSPEYAEKDFNERVKNTHPTYIVEVTNKSSIDNKIQEFIKREEIDPTVFTTKQDN